MAKVPLEGMAEAMQACSMSVLLSTEQQESSDPAPLSFRFVLVVGGMPLARFCGIWMEKSNLIKLLDRGVDFDEDKAYLSLFIQFISIKRQNLHEN